MSPAAKRPAKPPPPPKPWRRAEAGRYRSADERFTLESGGGGWFVTDDETLDELGLARTTGPFPTLDAAKAAVEVVREAPAEASPLAGRIAEAAARPKAAAEPKAAAQQRAAAKPSPEPATTRTRAAERAERDPDAEPESPPAGLPDQPVVAIAPRTWLDDLEDGDRDRAVRARRLVAALERRGITDADALVRRDLLGGTPAVVTRLLALEVLDAIAAVKDPSAMDVAAAVAGVLASSPKRAGLPGWDLLEREGPGGARRGLRLTADDLAAAAEHHAD
jgi:hypothetical protein